MATRKEARRRSLLQVLALIIGVVIIVVAAVLFQNWWNNRPGPAPKDVTVTAKVSDTSTEIHPYIVCELGEQCPEGEVPNIEVGPDDTLHLDLPKAISSHQWQVLTIYDDPAANDQKTHGSGEANSADIPGSVDPIAASTSGKDNERPRLKVVEVSAILIGTDDNGEETPFTTVWSMSTMSPEELAKDAGGA